MRYRIPQERAVPVPHVSETHHRTPIAEQYGGVAVEMLLFAMLVSIMTHDTISNSAIGHRQGVHTGTVQAARRAACCRTIRCSIINENLASREK